MRPSSTDLIQWADRLDCRARLPELVRRLVHATASQLDLQLVDFPACEGIQRPGVDGRVKSRSSYPFIPAGPSVWEIGTDQRVQAKADKDYRKRTDSAPIGVEPSRTTYVFVTPRRWSGRNEWAAARSAEGVWVELAPAAAAWLSRVLGLPADAMSLEDYWSEWSARTLPPTAEAVIRAGRD